MKSGEDKRRFVRYKHESVLPVIIGGDLFKGYLIDLSLGGLSFYINLPLIEIGSVVYLKIEDLNLDIQGKVVWTKEEGSILKVGIERLLLCGNLKHLPLSDILLGLQRSEKTGILEIRNGAIYKKIYIKNGDIIFATSNQEDDRLGELLLKSGRITLEQYYHSVDEVKRTGKRQGTIFAELGYLKPRELAWAVIQQVEEIILGLFQWVDGEFEFKEGPLPSDETITLKISVGNLIYRGIKRINNFTYFKNLGLSMAAIPDYSDDPMNLFQDIKLEEKEREVLFLIDGRRTIQEILSLSPLDNFRTLKILYGLLSTKIIEYKEENKIKECKLGELIMKEPEGEIDAAFVEKVEGIYNKLNSINYYDILGINENASPDEVRGAYYKKTKEFHPDRHFQLPTGTLKNKLISLFSFLTKAYETLSDQEMRLEYNKNLSSVAITMEERNSEIARAQFIEGKEALRKGSYTEATELFRQAIHNDNSVAVYHFCLGLVLEKEEKHQDAEKSIITALKLEPSNADYMAELGHIYLKISSDSKAKDIFEEAIKFDPSNERAIEGLQKIGIILKTQ